MCLLVVQPIGAPSLTQAWLEDFYSSNSDGVGIMRAVDGELLIEKILPTNAQEFVDFYLNHIDGHECAFHLRMKTHGNIDMENCHPYEVFNRAEHGLDVWLMHNGVLSTGNAGDTTKSDTWHYIRNYLRPMLANNIDFAFTDEFAEIIGDHIGASNKFVIMDNNGRINTVNQDSGVFWGGRWLSNTYAWSSPLNTSKTYKDDLGTALAEIEEPPKEKWKSTGGGNYKSWSAGYSNYGSSYSRYSSYDDWDDYHYNAKPTDNSKAVAYDRPTYVPPVGNVFDDEGDVDYVDMDEDDEPRSEVYGVSDAEIEDVMEDLLCEIEDMFEIRYISRAYAKDFIDEFGIDNFMEVAYMALDDIIDASWFERIMSDKILARQSFPWLVEGKEEQYEEEQSKVAIGFIEQ